MEPDYKSVTNSDFQSLSVMVVPMVKIRRVRMIVSHRRVAMLVGVPAAGRNFPGFMEMIVVAVIVRVAVIVGDLVMMVRMPMRLGEQ